MAGGEPNDSNARALARSLDEISRLLRHAADLSERYSGTILACAEIAGPTEHYRHEFESHFTGTAFAPLGRVRVFGHPLQADEFAGLVKIGQGTPNSPLHEGQLDGLKGLLSEGNDLPGFLRDARVSEGGFRVVTPENWPSIFCAPEARFINESQLRVYLLDHLLAELKDPGTPLLKECRCYRRGKSTGIADYFVKMDGVWIPVEAKLNVLATKEESLLEQLGKYTRVYRFVPTSGTNVGKSYAASRARLCIVVDHHGVYFASEESFRGCSFGKPLWRRDDLGHHAVPIIRERVAKEIGLGGP